MIKYNWKKVKQCAGGKPKVVLALMYLITRGVVPTKWGKYLRDLNLKGIQGDSFILNPEELLESLDFYSEAEVIMYIHLASLRNYTSYHLEGNASLPLLHADIHEKYIQQNGLLEIVGNIIHFKYEETKNGN